MKYKKHKQYRHPNQDYSGNGFYFVTICTKNHQPYFGDIVKSGNESCPVFEIELTEIGNIAKNIGRKYHIISRL